MSPFHPKVSVIMNCLNSEAYIRQAIESIYSQTYENWEIVLFDNASTDRTAEIAKRFDKKLCYFRNDTTVPLGQARNLALRQAKGEFIAFLDSDDSWHPTKLEKQIPLFYNDPSVGLVFSDTILTYQGQHRSTTKFKENNFSSIKGNMFSELLKNYSIPMLTVVIRREVLQALDEWFDNSFQCCDDYDFFLRVVYKWDCDYVNEPLANCLIHNEAVTVKFHQYAAVERLKSLDKFRLKYPGFEEQYEDEIKKLHKQIAYVQGKSHWRSGNGVDARNEFKKYVNSFKFFVTYWLTFLPYHWVKFLSTKIVSGLGFLKRIYYWSLKNVNYKKHEEG